jgi:tellurite resistance protein TerA
MLLPGANTPVNGGPQRVTIDFSPVPGVELDVSAFLLSTTGKVRSDSDMCFYGQPKVSQGAVELLSTSQGRVEFSINPDKLDAQIEKVALTATLHENRASFSAVSRLSVDIGGTAKADIPTKGMSETALILGEFYRRNGTWKFRCVGQGFNGGLEPLAIHFGVDVAKPQTTAPSPTPTPAPKPTPRQTPSNINLSKVTLDKSRSSISLDKGAGSFGEIKVNLNWNYTPAPAGGLLNAIKGKLRNQIDLDVGCLFEMEDGRIGVVQALGNAFGSYRYEPFIALMGDDRTGTSIDGEWLRINGVEWNQIRRILVFAFIYDGVPNWKATDAVVTLSIPGQPPVEVRVSEEGGSKEHCAIALLENHNGSVRMSREVRFFHGHEEMDRGYSWGLRWRSGRK